MAEVRVVRMIGLSAVMMSLVSLVLLTVTCLYFTQLYHSAAGIFIVMVCGLLSVILWDMYTQNPADSHTAPSLLTQYLIQRFTLMKGARLVNHLRSFALNTRRSQDLVLMEILRKSSSTEYGSRYGFENIHSREEFVERVPLSTYTDYAEFVKRLENEPDALNAKLMTSERVEYLGLTSGTTGAHKHLPMTEISRVLFGRVIAPLTSYNAYKRTGLGLGRVLAIGYGFEFKKSNSGVSIGPGSLLVSKGVPHALSPSEVFKITDELCAIHLHVLFGLMERDVERIESIFSSLIYSFWGHVERHWVELCDSVESGVLTARFRNNVSLEEVIGLEAAYTINTELKGRKSKARADELRKEFSKGFQGIALRIWPNLRGVRCVNTGSFAQYSQALKEVYMEGVTQITTTHLGTEGYFGINLPHNAPKEYTPFIHFGFFEFIPEDHTDDSEPDTLFIDQLELGGLYEIVYTSPVGLYRYRTGDVVKVTDFLNQCPVYSYEYRIGQVLNVYWEKTTETILHRSVSQAVDELMEGVRLVDYTTTESLLTSSLTQSALHTKFYVFFLELTSGLNSFALTDRDKLMFDEKLRQNSEVYDSLRQNDSIGPVKVIQVTGGTFQKLRHSSLCSVQKKQARVTRKKEEIELLLSNSLQS